MVGLVAAGIGTMAFLRNALIASLDEQVQQLTSTDVAVNALIETKVEGGVPRFTAKPDTPTDYFVAIYDGSASGDLVITAGGDGNSPAPQFPETMTLEQARIRGLEPFSIPGESGCNW